VLEAAEDNSARAARYRRAQERARSGRAEEAGWPRPLEFDESGFPIRQRYPGFAVRVARLRRAD
jgi:hypothetical protein